MPAAAPLPQPPAKRARFIPSTRWQLVLFAATLFIGGMGAATYHHLRHESRQATARLLAVIAEEKREQIENWVTQTHIDAKLYFDGTSLLQMLFSQWLEGGRHNGALLAQIQAHLAEVAQVRGWQGVAIYDSDGHLVFKLGEVDLRDHAGMIPEILNQPHIESIDLHRNAQGTAVYCVLAPIGLPATPLGVAYVSWRADQTLYPLISDWPIPTRTAETYLVRREGDQVRYLTPLRHQPEAALALTQPWRSFYPIADYASQSVGDIVQNTRDYRGAPMLAYLTVIADTPWLMIATIDENEAYAGIRPKAWTTSLITGLALLLMYSAGYLVWRREVAGLRARQEAEERLRLATEGSERELERYRQHLEELVRSRTLELIEARDAAVAANRAKSDFLAHMTHELRTPLHAILGFAEILAKMEDQDRDLVGQSTRDWGDEAGRSRRKLYAHIQRNGRHLLALVNDILDLSRLERGRLTLEVRPAALPTLLHECVDDLIPLATNKGLALHLEITPGLAPCVQVDRRRLQQVLNNLLGNAIKFTGQGEVRLQAATTPDPTTPGQLALCLTVVDTGSGIPVAAQDQIFDAFVQAAPGPGASAPQGSGLGLAISRQLVRQMGGEISLDSKPGQGSRFTLTLPAVSLSDPADCHESPTTDDDAGPRRTVGRPTPVTTAVGPPPAPPPLPALAELRELADLGRTTRIEDWCRYWAAPARRPAFSAQVLKLAHEFDHGRIIALVDERLSESLLDSDRDTGPDPDTDATSQTRV